MNRINSIIQNMRQVSEDNIAHIGVQEFLGRNFSHNIIIITEELKELESLRISDKFINDETNTIIDLFDNFSGLPIYNKVLFLPEITYEHADKIAKRVWNELRVTSDINKFSRFKDREVKTRKFDMLRYEEVEQEIDDLRNKINNYEKNILELKGMIDNLNLELDQKIDDIQDKEKEINKLNDLLRSEKMEYENEIIKLKRDIEDLQDREERYKKMLDEVSKKYDLVGFMGNYKVEDRKRRLIREAKENGKMVLGVIGKGKKFILNNIEENEKFIAVEEPERADYWIIVTTPDKESVELFKELVMSKPLNKSIKIMTLWNDKYPFTAESLVESNLDLVIPYYGDAHKLEWTGGNNYSNWKLELNSLIRHAFI